MKGTGLFCGLALVIVIAVVKAGGTINSVLNGIYLLVSILILISATCAIVAGINYDEDGPLVGGIIFEVIGGMMLLAYFTN